MEVGIITHYDVHNHGAMLQLYSLEQVLRLEGIEAKALRFDKNFDFKGVEIKSKYYLSFRSIPIYFQYLIKGGISKFIYNLRKRNTLNKFKRVHSLIGNYYTKVKELDAVVIGSDEVFALHTGLTPVFWGFALPAKNVFSFAGSFGPTTMADIISHHCEYFVISGLRSLRGISVRDENSREIVRQLIGITPELVCDPVILYSFCNEISQMKCPLKFSYLLVYAYDNRMNEATEVAAIKRYAKEHSLKIVSPGFYHDWCDYNIDVDPIELLSYFKFADKVITDTFHGSIMSLITHVDFAVKVRNENENKLYGLLAEYDLTNRIVKDFSFLEIVYRQIINWDVVKLAMEKKRELSMNFLRKMLREGNEYR